MSAIVAALKASGYHIADSCNCGGIYREYWRLSRNSTYEFAYYPSMKKYTVNRLIQRNKAQVNSGNETTIQKHIDQYKNLEQTVRKYV